MAMFRIANGDASFSCDKLDIRGVYCNVYAVMKRVHLLVFTFIASLPVRNSSSYHHCYPGN